MPKTSRVAGPGLRRLVPWLSDPELHPFRHNLQFAFFNTVTWQVALATPLVLFAQELSATPAQLGWLASLVLLLTPLQILSTALLPRLGYKRLMLAGWGLRSLVLIIPVALAVGAALFGVRSWMLPWLMGSVFVFCTFRAIGLAAQVPWFYALIPAGVRGRYFSGETAMLGISSVGMLMLSAASFLFLPLFPALALQFALALLCSLLAWMALRTVPDAPPPAPRPARTLFGAAPRLLLQRSEFRRYLLLSVLISAITTPIPSFIPYYLKAAENMAAGTVMGLETVRYLTMIFAAGLIRAKIDRLGARPYLLAMQALAAVFAGYWILHLNGWGAGTAGGFAAYFVLGLYGTAWNIGNAHYLPKVARSDDATLMYALHGAAVALAGGLSTLAWGRLLQPASGGTQLSPGAFTALFVTLLLGAVVVSWLLAARPEPEAEPAEDLVLLNTVLRPWRTALYLIQLAEPSRRPAPSARDD